MFEDLIWHGEDIVRRLEAERSLNAVDRMSYPDDQRVPVVEAEAWRREVERRIKAESGEYVLSRYHALRQQLMSEIHEQVGTELDRSARWHRRVVSLLRDLQRRHESRECILPVRLTDSEIPGIPTTAGYVDMRSTDIEELADLLQVKLHGSE